MNRAVLILTSIALFASIAAGYDPVGSVLGGSRGGALAAGVQPLEPGQ